MRALITSLGQGQSNVAKQGKSEPSGKALPALRQAYDVAKSLGEKLGRREILL
jgi:hypothetical protein